MALQPSRRDVLSPPPRAGDLAPIVRHHGQSLRSRDPGYVEGRWATPQPLAPGPSLLVGGDEDGDDVGASVIGEDGDRHTISSLATQVWSLSYVPISETVHVRFHPAGGAGVPWLRDEHFFIDEDSNVVTIPAEVLAAARVVPDEDFLSAQYLRLEGDEDAADELDDLVLRGTTMTIVPGTTADLPAGTEIGDLLVVGSAVMRSDGAPGLVLPSDGRLTRQGHGAWTGRVTNLDGVFFEDFGADDRFCGVVATYAPPAAAVNAAEAGPGAYGANPLTSPVVAANAAILVATTENPNGLGAKFTSVPADWVNDFDMNPGASVATVQIWHSVQIGADASPAGGLDYAVHGSGFAYATVIGLGEE